ncbi:type II toxin-antitoxin system VapC family toxin [Candidatus Poribacteria bacterium]|nr:type II toxin-antitoxin system VapC family toxin [Candidatus Poribacteria bacterium]
MICYVDTSAFIKRYAQEKNSDLVVTIFQIISLITVTSSWTINETVAGLDKKVAKKQMRREEADKAIQMLVSKSSEVSIDRCVSIMITHSLLARSTNLIIKHHISADDALHLASALMVGVDLLIAGDKRLIEAARTEGIESYNVEIDADAQLLRRKLEGTSQ